MPSSNQNSSRVPSARQSARDVVAQHQHKAASGVLLRWTVIAVALAVVAVVVVVLVLTERAEVPGSGSTPSSGNENGGIELVSPSELTAVPATGIDALGVLPPATLPLDPQGVAPTADQGPVKVVAWVDVNCVHCAEFETIFGEQIKEWLADGTITMEYRTVAYLDRNSATDYSSRAAAASACVADESPEAYLPFMEALFANFPQGELNNAELADVAEEVGAADISTCVDDGTYRPWVAYGTELAQRSGIDGTPTIYVEGERLADPASFIAAVDAARGTR